MGKETRNRNLILDLIDDFDKKEVLVIGDSILDHSVYSEAIGLSLETPTLKAKELKEEYSFGGAGNVVKNILELGARCSFITLLGQDRDLSFYKDFKHQNLNFLPATEEDRKNTVKRRFWVSRRNQNYKFFQIDKLDNREIGEKAKREVIETAERKIKDSDTVLLVDYRHGMMSSSLIDSLKKTLLKYGKPIIATSQISESKSNHLDYNGVNLICFNEREAKEVGNLEEKLDSDFCITLGEKGAMINLKGKEYFIKGNKVKEKDSCGAGDCFIAALSLGNYFQFPEESLQIANFWAALSVQNYGTELPKKQDLVNYFSEK